MDDRKTIWDPLRRKQVTLTPEEEVRQWFITRLVQDIKVPVHMMMSEAGFRLGDKQFRADIIVYDRHAAPLMVVECKRPQVDLTEEVLSQAIRYNMVLNVKFIVITNGMKTFICHKEMKDGKLQYVPSASIPLYTEMICRQ